jgi:hypothetical protein
VPVLADRITDRRPLVAASIISGLAGLVGILVAPDAAPVVWVALMGLGQGGGFALGLVKLVDYAPSPAASARLGAGVPGLLFDRVARPARDRRRARCDRRLHGAPTLLLVVLAVQLVLCPGCGPADRPSKPEQPERPEPPTRPPTTP